MPSDSPNPARNMMANVATAIGQKASKSVVFLLCGACGAVQPATSSSEMLSRATPRSVSLRITALLIIGEPQR